MQWPAPSTRTAITVTTDQAAQPSVLERSGPWSLFRMLDAGSRAGPAAKRRPRASSSAGASSAISSRRLAAQPADSASPAGIPLPDRNLSRCAADCSGSFRAKRDFVALSAPRAFLDVWEPWLQGGISASRLSSASGWQQAFLRAPIWRFWLGADICGATVAGAFMPSVDGVGRYFPLTVFACAEPGIAIPPPD